MTTTDVFTLEGAQIPSEEMEVDVVIRNDNLPNISTPNYNTKLSVYKHRNEILELIARNQVSIITSTPGSGKTSQIPQYILDSETEQRRFCNIVVTQPRKIAAISVAKFVSESRGLEIGTVVGHQVGLDKMLSPDTRLLYCTTGILLQKLIASKSLNEYTHVVLDEAHDRVKDMDFLFLIVRKFLRTISSHVKVIIMSATMEVDEVAAYFATFDGGIQRTPPVLAIDEPTFNVQLFYPEDIPELQPLDAEFTTEPRFDKNAVDQILTAITFIEQTDAGRQSGKEGRGTILIFVPGYQEIMTMDSEINRHFDLSYNFDVLPVHSEIALSDQWLIFKPARAGRRKIILATNIAESSITVPDVKYVIDPCMTKELMTDERTGYTGLLLVWASKSSCDQRKGRSGRLSCGTCIRLVSREFFTQLASVPTPEFVRTPLESVVLYTKMMDLGPPGMVLQLAMTPPSREAVKQSMLCLFELGGLVPYTNSPEQSFDDGELSFIGRVMATLPISVHLSRLIALGYVFGILDHCLMIAATSSVRQIFRYPFGDRLSLLRFKQQLAGGSCSEMMAGLNIFREWIKHTKLGILRSLPDRKRFANRHMVDLKRIEEAHRLYEDLKHRLKRMDIYFPQAEAPISKEWEGDLSESCDQAHADCLLIKLAIAGACYPNYFRMSPSNEREIERFLGGRDARKNVRIQRISSHGQPQVGQSVQMALESTYGFKNVNVDVESNSLYVSFNGIETAELPGMITDPFMNADIHSDVLLAVSIRDVVIPVRNGDETEPNETGKFVPFQKFYVDRQIRLRGRHIASFGIFTAAVVSSSSPQWSIGQVIECRLCGIKAPSEEELKSQGMEALKQCLIGRVVDAEIVTVVGAVHFVEIRMGAQRLSDCLVAGGVAEVDTRCISRSFVSMGRMRSPLRTLISGITHVTRGYSALISPSDINGHMLDLFPKCPFERLVVAAEVRRTNQDASLQLFNTTVMPPIAGLMHIVIMLFCPAIQLRTDEFRSQLVGFIGGMGSYNTRSYHPDHDVDLEFDCAVSRKDIEKINRVRELMGTLLGSNASPATWHMSAKDIQQEVRVLLYRLLIDKKRPYRRPLDYSNDAYRWSEFASGAECGLFMAHRLPKINTKPLLDAQYVKCLLRKERELQEDSKAMRAGDVAYCYLCDILLSSKGHVITHFRTEMHRSNVEVIQEQSARLG